MTRQSTQRTNSEDPASIRWWEDYAEGDGSPVSSYLFESGESASPVGDLTVDASDYTTRAFHEREVEGLWTKVWQVACRANDVPDVGDYLEYEIVGQSILVVRDATETVRAFRNACRHRGSTVATGCGTASCFVCPFHGWTYGLDGSLQVVPAGWDFSHVDVDSHGLVPVQAEVFNGWVFVNLDDDAAPLREFLGETISRHLLVHPSERMWKAYHFGMVVPSNWKVMMTAFMEAYHIARTHPELVSYAGDIQARYDMFGLHSRVSTLTMVPSLVGGAEFTEQEILEASVRFNQSRYGEALEAEAPTLDLPEGMTAREYMADMVRQQWNAIGVDLASVSDTELIDGFLYLLFPNFMPFVNPAGHVAYRSRPNGDDHTTCIFEVMSLVPVPPGEDPPRDAPLHMLEPGEKFEDFAAQMGSVGYILDQDVANSASVQKGLRGIDTLNFAEKQERNIVAFHRNLDSWMRSHSGRARGGAASDRGDRLNGVT